MDEQGHDILRMTYPTQLAIFADAFNRGALTYIHSPSGHFKLQEWLRSTQKNK